jgi:hypothetical protein
MASGRSIWQRFKDWMAGKWENSRFYKKWVVGEWDPAPRKRQWFLGWGGVVVLAFLLTNVTSYYAGGLSRSFAQKERVVYVEKPSATPAAHDLVAKVELDHWVGRATQCEAQLAFAAPPLTSARLVPTAPVPPAAVKPVGKRKPKSDPTALDKAATFVGWPWFGE